MTALGHPRMFFLCAMFVLATLAYLYATNAGGSLACQALVPVSAKQSTAAVAPPAVHVASPPAMAAAVASTSASAPAPSVASPALSPSPAAAAPPAPLRPSCAVVMGQLAAPQSTVAWPPICPLPVDSPLIAAYAGPDGSMPINAEPECYAQRYEGESTRTLDWNAAFVDKYCAGIADGSEGGSYGTPHVDFLRATVARLRAAAAPGTTLTGTVGMVMGSESPWVECVALNAGADTVWTLEYSHIAAGHPQLRAKPAAVMAAEHAAGTLPPVDWIMTYSSLEHSGLGRYGDPLNPDGDRDALQQAWCFLKPGGLLLLSLPMACAARGFISYNAHRAYGYKRLAYVAGDWEVLSVSHQAGPCEVMRHSMYVLRKPLLPADDGAAASTEATFAEAPDTAGAPPPLPAVAPAAAAALPRQTGLL